LDYLNLVSKFDEGKTIKLVVSAEPSNSAIRKLPMIHHVIIDTGADNTAFTKEFLKRRGYGKYQRSGFKTSTATGEIELLTYEINGLTLASQFKFGKMKVDVLEKLEGSCCCWSNWHGHSFSTDIYSISQTQKIYFN